MTGRRVKDHTMIGVYARNNVVDALRLEAERQNRTISNMAAQALNDWCVARGLITRDKTPVKVAGS